MSIVVTIVTRNFPYGNPGSVGEPLGLWSGESNTTGDATGGFVQIGFVPQNPTTTPTLDDQRRQYMYFIDGVMILASTDPGNLSVAVPVHFARANAALGDRYRWQLARNALPTGTNFAPDGPLLADYVTRQPIFWDTQELVTGTLDIATLTAEINTLATLYQFRCYGRYYDRQVVGNRGFGRLISPTAISQFEG